MIACREAAATGGCTKNGADGTPIDGCGGGIVIPLETQRAGGRKRAAEKPKAVMWTRWPGEGSTGQARDEDGFASQVAAQPAAEAQAVPTANHTIHNNTAQHNNICFASLLEWPQS